MGEGLGEGSGEGYLLALLAIRMAPRKTWSGLGLGLG